MRKNYPLLSQEINDIFQDVYYKLVYVIGYDSEDTTQKTYGKYDEYEAIIKEQINTLIFNFLNDENQPVYRDWGRHIIRRELRRM